MFLSLRVRNIFSTLSSVVIVSISGCKSELPAAIAPSPQAVKFHTLDQQELILTRELPGRVVASLVAEVRPQVNGIVNKLFFDEGGMVKAGQPLYQLNDDIYAAQHSNAKAVLARAKAALHSAELNAKRSAELVNIDAVSKQDHENAEAIWQQADAEVAAAKTEVKRTGVIAGYTRVTSPITGRIGKSAVTQGALVTANQPNALATVQKFDPMFIDLNQSSRELVELRSALELKNSAKVSELPVQIFLEDGTLYNHTGKLAFTDLTVDPGTGSVTLRVAVPNPDSTLLPGMYVRAILGRTVRRDALLVPQQGITRQPKGTSTAMVVGKGSKVESRIVHVSRTVGDKWLVESGLTKGDRVIIRGLQKIKVGDIVSAHEAETTVTRTAILGMPENLHTANSKQ